MWYFAWILGTLLACAFGIITARRLSTLKRVKPVKKKANDPYYRKTVCGNGQAPVKGAFLRDGDSAGRMYVLGPVTVCRRTSTLEIWHGLLLMWAVCAGIIHGVGFRPESVHWQGIFVRSLRISSLSLA